MCDVVVVALVLRLLCARGGLSAFFNVQPHLPSLPQNANLPLFSFRYIEASKTRIGSFAAAAAAGEEGREEAAARARNSRRTLVYVFDTCLRLLHPFMPFVTEALWQQLPRKGDALMVAPWPKVDDTPLAIDELAINR